MQKRIDVMGKTIKKRTIYSRLNKYTSGTELQEKIRKIMCHYIFDTEDNTYEPICNDLRTLEIEIVKE